MAYWLRKHHDVAKHSSNVGGAMLKFLIFILCFMVFIHSVSSEPRMKVHISADMEGIAGVVTDQQLSPEGFEYARFREFMTAEVNAAIEGAVASGATEIVVSDSHGNGQNILLEKLPENVTLVRSWPRPLGMMQGIDNSFTAAIFIGYHSGTTNPQGVRAHTFSSANLADVRLNNLSVPEAGVNAAIAGHFNVPVICISGDDAVAKEVQAFLPNVETAVVKWALGFHSAKTMTPQASANLIREKVKNAFKRLSEIRPYKVQSPVQLDVTFKNYRPSEVLSFLGIVERTNAHSIRFQGKDMVEISKFLQFVLNYEPSLHP
jgi:D-amino peptidase